MSSHRLATLTRIATRIRTTRAIRIGIDGVDGAGKTIFADQLAAVLDGAGSPVVRVSLDGFHRPRRVRYRRGRTSPEGCWLDSFDYAQFRAEVLDPFSPYAIPD
jgi:uridine kinase